MNGMNEHLLHHLASIYDRGRLVPLLGSGMSRPACVDWPTFVGCLEKQADLDGSSSKTADCADLISRAEVAMRYLRLGGYDVAACVGKAVYAQDGEDSVPCQTNALARLFWPLVCTTNYDDVFLRAKVALSSPPRVRGRNYDDCHRVLQHLRFPMGETVWALQGFLGPRADIADGFQGITDLKSEIVVGHAEYRRTANREPHFRRCFAEVFRNSSLLFLGAGLAEPYFLSLFDEIIELTGPSINPHFAVVQEGEVDPDFMRRRFHIDCTVYKPGDHQFVCEFLTALADTIADDRVRQRSWGVVVKAPRKVSSGGEDDFTVVRAKLPDPDDLPANEAVAISCGRQYDKAVPGVEIADSLGLVGVQPRWYGDEKLFSTFLRDQGRCVYGITAREGDKDDRRTPRVVNEAFRRALDIVCGKDYQRLHVQLLAAGPDRSFRQWISLVQMARAYGAWYRKGTKNRIRVSVYVVDPSVITLLCGGHLDLAEHLDDTSLRVGVMIIPTQGLVERYLEIVPPACTVRTILHDLPTRDGVTHGDQWPHLEVYPPVYRGTEPARVPWSLETPIEELGLVSGSTLIVDYRAR